MNLEAISKHVDKLKGRKVKDSNYFHLLLLNYALRYKIDLVEFSTVGADLFGNSLMSFDRDGSFLTKYFTKSLRKEDKEKADEELSKVLNTKYKNKRDFITIFRNFWGVSKVIFYCSETDKQFVIEAK